MLILTAASLRDLRTGRIDNRLILCGLAAGLLLLFLPGTQPSVANRLAAAGLTPVLFWPLFRCKAFGAGDIKLMAVVGLLTGLQTLFIYIAAGLFVAAAAGTCILLYRRELRSSLFYSFSRFREMLLLKKIVPMESGDAGFHKMCFAPALLCGCFLVQLCQLWQNLL